MAVHLKTKMHYIVTFDLFNAYHHDQHQFSLHSDLCQTKSVMKKFEPD